jgi:hypothetical protein
MTMPEPWTHAQLDQLDAVVQGLLGSPLPPPILWALTQQAALLNTCLKKRGQQRQLIHRLSREVETLTAILEGVGDAPPWETGDERRW